MISYLITDPKLYGVEKKEFINNLQNSLKKHSPDFICFRDKVTSNYFDLASVAIELKKEFKATFFLNGTPKDAKALGYDGVHLNSKMIERLKDAETMGLKTIVSTHNEDELLLASSLNATFMTYSPIFSTPNKGTPKGLDGLRSVTKQYKNIIALGGIDTKEKIDLVKQVGACGFASIRYFRA